MIVNCERCEARFELDDARVAGAGLRVRCSHCKHAFWLDAPVASLDEALEQAVSEALEPSPPVIEDLLDASRPEVEPDEDWEFAELSEADGEAEGPGAAGETGGGESSEEAAEVLTLEPLEQGEPVAPQEAAAEALAFPAFPNGDSTSEFATEEVDGALAALSAWEPEAENLGEPALALQAAVPTAAVSTRTFRPLEAPELSSGMGRVGTLAGWLAVLFLVAVGLHAGVVVEAGPRVAPLQVAELGGYRLSEVQTRWVDNLYIGPLLVVSGRVRRLESSGTMPLAMTLLDADGVALVGHATPVGPALPRDVLRLASPREIQERQSTLARVRTAFRPGESRRFDAVFAAVPDAASQLRVGRLLE